MNFPIIEVRNEYLFVSQDFDGEILKGEIKRRYNFHRNLTKYVIDSNGEVWEFFHKSHNHHGLRRVLSILWNKSSDLYSYSKHLNKDVNWLKAVLKECSHTENPDLNELAEVLIEDLHTFEGNTILSPTVMEKLNL